MSPLTQAARVIQAARTVAAIPLFYSATALDRVEANSKGAGRRAKRELAIRRLRSELEALDNMLAATESKVTR